MTEPRLRGRIRDAVARLHRVDDELAELAESLVLPPDAVEMWESRIPTSFQVNLYLALGAVRSDCIQDAITTLLHVAGQSDISLRRQFLRGQPLLSPVEPVEFVARVGGNDAVEPGAELGAVGGRRKKKDGVPFRVDKHSGEAGRKETPSC